MYIRNFSKVINIPVDDQGYDDGDCLGGLVTIPGIVQDHKSIELHSLYLYDYETLGYMSVFIFSENPTNSTFTDHNSKILADADLYKLSHYFPYAHATTLFSSKIMSYYPRAGSVLSGNIPIDSDNGSLYLAVVADGDLLTFSGSLEVKLNFTSYGI